MQPTHFPRKAFLCGLMAWAAAFAAGRLFGRGTEPANLSSAASPAVAFNPKAQARTVPYKHLSA